MKILLINPPVFNDIGHVLAHTPPLSLMYLAGFIEKNGYLNIKVIDADALQLTWQDLRNLLVNEKPDIVGVTGPSFVLPALIKTVQLAREVLPNCIIVTGGFGSTQEPEKVLRAANQAVNFIVMGEGEVTFLELIQQLESGAKEFNNINGLAYLNQNNNLIITKSRDCIKNLDSLPWPAYHLLEPDFSKYTGMHAGYKEMPHPTGILFASRGCPHRCTFCSLSSKMYRCRSPKDIVDEMEFYRNKFKLKSIQVYDDEFIGLSLAQNRWIKEICDEIIKRNLHKSLTFLVQGRCSSYVELETLKRMREANFVWIWWGVESGSQKVLDSIKKDIQIENIIKDFALAKQADIKSLMFIMVGFPGETPADIKLTTNLIKKINPDQVRIHIVSPYPGSKLRKYFEEHNLLETTDCYKFDSRNNVIHHTEEMTAEEIKKYFRMLVFRFENGYWYFIKFWLGSLESVDGWKKLLKRIGMAGDYFWSWVKIKFNL